LIEGYLEKIHAKKNELAKEQEIATDQTTIEHVEGNVISITNPQKVVTRGRPKSAKLGHNIATCPYKAK
ncbi:12866_t:CDS:2, partial [Gigaspora margarita]